MTSGEVHWTQTSNSATPRSGMYTQIPPVTPALSETPWYHHHHHHHLHHHPSLHHHLAGKPPSTPGGLLPCMSTSSPNNAPTTGEGPTSVAGGPPPTAASSPLYGGGRNSEQTFRISAAGLSLDSSPTSRYPASPVVTTSVAGGFLRGFPPPSTSSALSHLHPGFESFSAMYRRGGPPPPHHFADSPYLTHHYPSMPPPPHLVQPQQRRTTGMPHSPTTPSGFNPSGGQVTRPSPPILPNASARGGQGGVGTTGSASVTISSSAGGQYSIAAPPLGSNGFPSLPVGSHFSSTEHMIGDKKSRTGTVPASFMNPMEPPTPFYSLPTSVSTGLHHHHLHPSPTLTSPLTPSGVSFNRPTTAGPVGGAGDQSASGQKIIEQHASINGGVGEKESGDRSTSTIDNDSHNGGGGVVTFTTEAEVQKLLTIALSNSQQRLERSSSTTDVICNNNNASSIGVDPSPIHHENNNKPLVVMDNNEESWMEQEHPIKLEATVAVTPVAAPELSPAALTLATVSTELETTGEAVSLDASQETRNAMESSGSPAPEVVGERSCVSPPMDVDAEDYQEPDPAEDEDDEMDDGEGDFFPAPSPSEPDDLRTSCLDATDCAPEDSNPLSNPTESERLSPDSDDGMTLARFELFTSTIQPDKEGLFFCHLCEFTGKTRQEFHDHLRTHYDYKCPKCDYTSRTEGRLKRHLKDFHSEVPPQNFSGKTARINKPKHLKCKQCDFLAQNKDEYWKHQRLHIKEEKQLECPRCPFVTEYKHHLEYHIRNHFGSKPYKCPKCNYECVNKSMLNSHMKSHTNVYQYRCADCHYATKYCHSLKLHLTKNNHNPATVLNSDGSLPEYDNSSEILNMKRGPPRGPRSANHRSNCGGGAEDDTNSISGGGALVPNFMNLPPTGDCPPVPFFGPSGPAGHGGGPHAGLWNLLPPGFPHNMPPIHLPGFPKMGTTAGFPPTGGLVMPPPSMQLTPTDMAGNPAFSASRFHNFMRARPPLKSAPETPNEFSGGGNLATMALPSQCSLCDTKLSSHEELISHLFHVHSGDNLPKLPSSAVTAPETDMSLALDLTCSPSLKRELPAISNSQFDSADSISGHESPVAESSENLSVAEGDTSNAQDLTSGLPPSRKRPRKSKAFHLDDLCARFTADDKHQQQQQMKDPGSPLKLEEQNQSVESAAVPRQLTNENVERSTVVQSPPSLKKDYYECHHCDILFRGRTLFDIHMGYHCHADPFLCNRCGRQSRDNVEFFTHLGEIPHA